MIRINQINVQVNQKNTEQQLRKKASQILKISDKEIKSLRIVRQSIDARKKPDIFYSYVIDIETNQEEKVCKRAKNSQVSLIKPVVYRFPAEKKVSEMIKNRPVIIGMGPAGLFCGYFLAKAGFQPILLERGADVDTRMKDVETFWQGGVLKPDSNVQFGEGGAGTFSDGKLNTLVKDKDGRNAAVLKTFVEFGAKESILYEAKPHIGTDVLCGIVKRMRQEIIRLGGEVRFDSKVTELKLNGDRITGVIINGKEEFCCDHVVLAIGHSARDTFDMLYEKQVPMEAKSFAVGLRVEHPQTMINVSQYGMTEPGTLGAAPYKVAAQTSVGRGVYSFCMCPGGYVVNASSEPGRLAVNGMSYSGRDGENANSAIIVSVTPEDFGSDHPLAGIAFQRELEKRAYELGQGKIPVQRYGEFRRCVEQQRSEELQDAPQQSDKGIHIDEIPDAASKPESVLIPQNKGGYVYADVSQILPAECNKAFVEGMTRFGQMIPGFDREDTLLSGVESRTSSPVRIHRDDTLQSAVRGLYPCGEGAGYAGGITSAAMDGIRVAEAVAAAICRNA
ncbi:MAG: FAD-dependent oxidoreductase [Lachnospiraceae bacterium]|nr:FAD-dependent oxidoreductase [Lachnospiraceae bacterium]